MLSIVRFFLGSCFESYLLVFIPSWQIRSVFPPSSMDFGEQPSKENKTGQAKMEDTEGPTLTALEIQQQYFENVMDCDWVIYERRNHRYLVQNIAFALFGPPSNEGEMTAESKTNGKQNTIENADLQGYTSRQLEQVAKIYEKLCEQGKYSLNDMDIVMSVLLIVCCRPNPRKFYQLEPSDYWCDLHKRSDIVVWCTAVLRVRKCIPHADGGSPSCRLYVDEDARVYHSWESYLNTNTLPKCVMVVPRNGEYKGDLDKEYKLVVRLTVVGSPALGTRARVLSAADTTSTVASVGAIGVLGASLFTPVAPVVLAGAAVATVATGVYGFVRSSLHLHDLRTHEQTLNPKNPEARGSWINIAASTVGVGAGAASTLLSRSAAAGTNMTKYGVFLEKSVNVLRHANVVAGGAGIANSLVHLVVKFHKHGERPSKLEMFQFAASTLFFMNAVISNKTAQTIIEEAQAKTINDYRDSLRSNRHRKIFDKMSAETRRVQGGRVGNTEVIRSIRSIANKDQYFTDVLRINKDVNTNRMRISMTADGKVNLNAQHTFSPSELSSLSKDARAELFSRLGPADLSVSNVPTRLTTPTAMARMVSAEDEETSFVSIRAEEVLRIGSLLCRVTSYSNEQMADMLHNLSAELHNALVTLAMNVLSQLLPDTVARMRLLSPDKDLIVQVVEFVFEYLKRYRPLGEARSSDNGIVVVLREFFQDGHVRKDTAAGLARQFSEFVRDTMDERRQRYPNKREIVCNACGGIRYA